MTILLPTRRGIRESIRANTGCSGAVGGPAGVGMGWVDGGLAAAEVGCNSPVRSDSSVVRALALDGRPFVVAERSRQHKGRPVLGLELPIGWLDLGHCVELDAGSW